MKSLFIYWNYSEANIIFLWKLIDQIKITYPKIKICCQLKKPSLAFCRILELENVTFYELNLKVNNKLQLKVFDLAILFHPKKEDIFDYHHKKVKTICVSSKYMPHVDIIDNLEDPFEKILNKVLSKLKVEKTKREKPLSKLFFKNQKVLDINVKSHHQIIALVDVSGFKIEDKSSTLFLGFIELLIKDSRNFLILIGETTYDKFIKINNDNCLNKINKINFFQHTNMLKKVDILIAEKSLITNYFSMRNKAVLEIATQNSPNLIRNSVSNYYSKIINFNTLLASHKINKICLQINNEFNSLLKRYNLNIKNNSKDYLDECFIIDNPLLLIFSSNDELNALRSNSLFFLAHFLIIRKWTWSEYFKISKEIDSASIKVICGHIPLFFEIVLKFTQWIKKSTIKITFININIFKKVSITDYISTISYILKKRYLR